MKERSIKIYIFFTFFMGNAMVYFYVTNMLQRGNSTCGYKKKGRETYQLILLVPYLYMNLCIAKNGTE